MPCSSSSEASAVSRISVCANSLRKPATRSPSAHNRPGEGGTMTGKEPISSATALACSGPAPPKATSANSRGSWPRWTLMTRSAPAMFSLTIRRMPSAAASTVSPIGVRDRAHRGPRRVDVERHLAADQVGREVAEHDVGVGHGRLGPALAVGGGPGLGARGLRADAQRAGELRDVRDRAAAGADGVHVDARDLDPELADRGLAADRRLARLAQRDVGRGAAHVERQDVREARARGDVERACDAPGRAAERPRRPGCAPPPAASSRRHRCAGCRPRSSRRGRAASAAAGRRSPPPAGARRSSCTPSACARTRGTPAARRSRS